MNAKVISLQHILRQEDGRFDRIFTQVVELLSDEGLISLDVQYIDGTKIESVANKYTFVWRGSVEKNKARLEKNAHRPGIEQTRRSRIKISFDPTSSSFFVTALPAPPPATSMNSPKKFTAISFLTISFKDFGQIIHHY